MHYVRIHQPQTNVHPIEKGHIYVSKTKVSELVTQGTKVKFISARKLVKMLKFMRQEFTDKKYKLQSGVMMLRLTTKHVWNDLSTTSLVKSPSTQLVGGQFLEGLVTIINDISMYIISRVYDSESKTGNFIYRYVFQINSRI